ncbi:hypothetical protein FQA39_LY14872 [Lamprigera yunnana]|nr:hypothetical protein FQA39_LY14872 [Lamprigera yunnana]
MYKKRRASNRTVTELNKCTQNSFGPNKKYDETFQSKLKLMDGARCTEMPLSILTKNRINQCTAKALRRSKRILKKNVSVKVFDCVSDYYEHTQNKDRNLSIEFNEKLSKMNNFKEQEQTVEPFCEILQAQMSKKREGCIKAKTIASIRNLVAKINLALDRSKLKKKEENDLEIQNEWFFEPLSVSKVTTNTPSTFLYLNDSIHKENFTELTPLKDEQDEINDSFTFDEQLLLPTMPELKDPSPLNNNSNEFDLNLAYVSLFFRLRIFHLRIKFVFITS